MNWRILFLMILAAASVVVCLEVFNSILATFIVYHIIICLLIPLLIAKRKYLKEVGLKPINGIKIGILHGIGLIIIIFVGYLIFRDMILNNNAIQTILANWGITGLLIIPMTLFMIIFNGVAEELFWRGYAQPKLKLSILPAVIITSVIYASYHAITIFSFLGFGALPISLFISVFLAGILWGWLREKYKSIWPSLLGHALATLGYMLVYVFLIS